MDIPRYALIAASVLLGVMLLGEWTRFSSAQQEAALSTMPMVEAEAAAQARQRLAHRRRARVGRAAAAGGGRRRVDGAQQQLDALGQIEHAAGLSSGEHSRQSRLTYDP